MTRKEFTLQYTISNGWVPEPELLKELIDLGYLEEEANPISYEEIEPDKDRVLSYKLEECGLPTRAIALLYRNEIYTVGDVLKAGKWKILKIRKMGRKTLTAIQQMLESFGLGFESGMC